MDFASASPLSLLAAGYYCLIAAFCFVLYFRRRRSVRSSASARLLGLAGAMMIGFALARVFGLEELARSHLRLLIETQGLLEQRRTFQPLILVLLGGGAAFFAWHFFARQIRRPPNLEGWASLSAGLAMIGLLLLICARLVSWHALDSILYAELIGPVRLNWILDLGLASVLGISAVVIGRLSGDMR